MKHMRDAGDNSIYWLLLVYLAVGIFVLINFNGTGDGGDSVHHYLFAKYAPIQPALFFNHWAKPLFVLLSSPFAQFGFTGIKVFNILVTALTMLFTFKIATHLKLKHAIIASVILMFCPLCFILTFSGLTEPLFALILSIGIYLAVKERYFLAGSMISFLPFVRSEGLIFLGVFGLYFLVQRKWKTIPSLVIGHVVYSVAGYFIYHDLFWVFNKIPYARLSSVYGSGAPFHFFEQLIYVVGVPIFILTWVGVLSVFWDSIKQKSTTHLQILIFIGFFAFMIAHSLFWYLGIFNSMGLIRVMIGIGPLIAILALLGFNVLTESSKNKTFNVAAKVIVLAYIFVFPFTSNKAAIDWKKDLSLTVDQQTAIDVGEFISKNSLNNHRFIYTHPYLSQVLELNHFDHQIRLDLSKDAILKAKSGDIIIWENWFSVVEHDLQKSHLQADASLKELKKFYQPEKNHPVEYIVFQKQ